MIFWQTKGPAVQACRRVHPRRYLRRQPSHSPRHLLLLGLLSLAILAISPSRAVSMGRRSQLQDCGRRVAITTCKVKFTQEAKNFKAPRFISSLWWKHDLRDRPVLAHRPSTSLPAPTATASVCSLTAPSTFLKNAFAMLVRRMGLPRA